jgi:hypothetical protein
LDQKKFQEGKIVDETNSALHNRIFSRGQQMDIAALHSSNSHPHFFELPVFARESFDFRLEPWGLLFSISICFCAALFVLHNYSEQGFFPAARFSFIACHCSFDLCHEDESRYSF